MAPVSAILSLSCFLPPSLPPPLLSSLPPLKGLNSCLLSLLHIQFSDSGSNKKTCYTWMGTELRSLSKWLLLKHCIMPVSSRGYDEPWVRFQLTHGGLGTPVTQWGSQETKVLGSAVCCSPEGLSRRLCSHCPLDGQGRGNPLLHCHSCVIRTGNWVKWSLEKGHGWVLLSISWAHSLLRVF